LKYIKNCRNKLSDERTSQRQIFKILASDLTNIKAEIFAESNIRRFSPCDRNLNADTKFATGCHWGRFGWDGSCCASTSELRCIGTR